MLLRLFRFFSKYAIFTPGFYGGWELPYFEMIRFSATLLSCILMMLPVLYASAKESHDASMLPPDFGINESSVSAPCSSTTLSEHQRWTASGLFFHSAAIGTTAGITKPRLLNMPKNARQTTEGYWIGATPTCAQLKTMYMARIRLIITAAFIDKDQFGNVPACIREIGFEHLNIPFGARFPAPSRFIKSIRKYTPSEIYIHCEHGGDRSGAILAYLLISEHGWPIARAFLAVLFPGMRDLNNLLEILQSRNIPVDKADIEQYLGIYSGESNFGYCGLKIRSDGYRKLIHTTLNYALQCQPQTNPHPQE